MVTENFQKRLSGHSSDTVPVAVPGRSGDGAGTGHTDGPLRSA
jgi:hypothetical protein